MGVTITYATADGSPFPVTFADEDAAAKRWALETEHSVQPGSPLADGLRRLGRPGMERAYTDSGIPVPSWWAAGPEANGFEYYGADDLPPAEELTPFFEAFAPLIAEHGGALGIWHDRCLPRTKAAIDALEAAPPDTPPATLAELHDEALHNTMIPSMVLGNDVDLVTAVIADLFPSRDEAQRAAYELAQGHPSSTLDAAQDLWELARACADDETMRAALADADPAAALARLRRAGSNGELPDRIDAHLATYGSRGETWSIDTPTWGEPGGGFWHQLRRLGAEPSDSPASRLAAAAARRDALRADLDGKLAADPDQRARFGRRVDRLSVYVPVREERAHWQLVGSGALRRAVLRIGAALADRGWIADADDIRFLRPTEIETADGDLRDLVRERRDEHERWRRVVPPAEVGGEPASPPGTPTADDGVVRGLAAGRGRHVGSVRIVDDPTTLDHFEPGDVLVCSMTAPPWIPLFGLAGAVVTDSGGLSSHPALAAREYGLPCVVGTGDATRRLRDGQRVEVDGDAGTVRPV